MARRVVMGRISGSTFDVRISRPGYDALTANVNNQRQISFSALRAANARVASAGEVSSLNTWKSFGQTFANPPPMLALLKRGNFVITDLYQRFTHPTGYLYGTPFCLVVQNNRFMGVNPTPQNSIFDLNPNDKFIYYMLSDD